MMMKGGRWPWGRDFCKVAVLGGEGAAKQGWRLRESAVADRRHCCAGKEWRRGGVEEWRSGVEAADDDACERSLLHFFKNNSRESF